MDKSPDAFRTISEVAEDLDLPQHVLRFWETRFVQIRPLKRGGGRRYYRPDDIDLLCGIRHLLFYGPPNVHWLYPELVNFLGEAAGRGEPVSVTVLYTRADALALERVVGTERAARLLDPAAKPTTTFV